MGYIYAPEARKDLKSIGSYSFRIWGDEQRVKYLKAIEQTIETLAERPYKG